MGEMAQASFCPTPVDRVAEGKPEAKTPLSALTFRVAGEGEDWLVVEKPAGLLCHPTRPDGPRTLWHGLRELLAFETHTGRPPAIITRLDRETSGLVLVAKGAAAAAQFGRMVASGKIQKRYLAVVFGWPQQDCWSVEAPIVRAGEFEASRVWLRRTVHPQGAPSVTRFRVIERWGADARRGWSLLEALPVTGRTHQIRVHLAHCGLPLVGDKLYAGGEEAYLHFTTHGWDDYLRRVVLWPRQALHAASLSWCSGEETVEVTSPLPVDFPEPGGLAKISAELGGLSVLGKNPF